MSQPEIRIVKVGGSLFDFRPLPHVLREWLAAQPGISVLIAGGGPFADAIRIADARFQLGEEASHDLCLRAMSVSARLLAAMLPGFLVYTKMDELRAVMAAGRQSACVFDPSPELLHGHPFDSLPCRWTVTSDSIAARFADALNAELVLLKSRDLPHNVTWQEASDLKLVDEHFPIAAAGLSRIRWVNPRGGSSCHVDSAAV